MLFFRAYSIREHRRFYFSHFFWGRMRFKDWNTVFFYDIKNKSES